MSRLGHGALIRLAGLHIRQPLLDVVPASFTVLFLGMQAEFQDELNTEAHHRVGGGNGVRDQVTGCAGLDLLVEPVEIIASIDRQGLKDRVRRIRVGAVNVKWDETVHEECAFGGVEVENGFRVQGRGVWNEVVEGVVG